MKVRLTGSMSGTRDGVDWPPRGSTIDLPDDEAIALCQNGMAVPVPADDVRTAVADQAVVESRALTSEAAPALARRRKS